MKTHRLTLPLTKLLLAAAILAIPIARPCRAQYAIGTTYSASHLRVEPGFYYPNNIAEAWVFGPTFSFQLEEGSKHIKFGFDARGAVLRGSSNGSNYGVNSADYGFRVAVPIHPLHVKPYGEFLIGYVGVHNGLSSAQYTGHIDLQTIAGIDVPLRHHLDLRAIEYAYGGIFGGGEDFRNQISSGLLVRF